VQSMRQSPYRTAWVPEESVAARHIRMGNSDLVPVFGAIWLLGVVRLGFAFAQEERFGTELSLIFATVTLITVFFFSARFGRSA